MCPVNGEREMTERNESSSWSISSKLHRWQLIIVVGINTLFIVIGQSAGSLLGRYYYEQGGNSKWMATLVQSAGFPVLYIALLFFPKSPEPPDSPPVSYSKLLLLYFSLGALLAGDNMLYSTALLYLSASTYSLVCASQLAFNAVFSFFFNHQKLTFPILSSVVILTLSATLIGMDQDASRPSGVSKWQYISGILCAVAASACYSLLLSLTQVSFERVLKKETFKVVIDMQIYTSLVATIITVIGLFASGEWKTLHAEFAGFKKGRVSYVMTLVWIALSWQMCSVGLFGIVFIVSSLFSNVLSTVALAVSVIGAVVVFKDKMNGTKAIAMVLAFYGFICYGYHNYLHDVKPKKHPNETEDATRNTLMNHLP